jgi:hypothetical protein
MIYVSRVKSTETCISCDHVVVAVLLLSLVSVANDDSKGATLTSAYSDGGKTITVGIVDRCEGCALWDLDLSPSAFQQVCPGVYIFGDCLPKH